ncbi:Transient-receptor-potential-like protein [Papilio machaon]|uniref:Transient-receptor-potential-like protein n=1 Tax=Papilio machaon TaxID=76193 RepID=A0A0N1IFM8_PAPMA|nr:Transient-receptor-potential-like protein [Papilio machaon]
MRALVWRYVSAMHRKMDDDPVTEDDINELKGDVSSLRYELLEVFEKNGMDVSFTDRKEKTVLAKRMKIWERRLMKDFKVAPVPPVDDEEKPEHETALSRFRRIAKMAVASTSTAMWDRTLAGAGISTQIGRCRTRQSFKNQQNLQKAMDEARKLVTRSPLPEGSRVPSPIEMPLPPGHTLLELIKDISTEIGQPDGTKSPWKSNGDGTAAEFLSPSLAPSRAVSPTMRVLSPNTRVSRATSPNPLTLSTLPQPASLQCDPEFIKPTQELSSINDTSQTTEDILKAAKKKAPDASKSPNHQADLEVKDMYTLAIARPVAPEIKPAEGGLPPPPAKPKVSIDLNSDLKKIVNCSNTTISGNNTKFTIIEISGAPNAQEETEYGKNGTTSSDVSKNFVTST